ASKLGFTKIFVPKNSLSGLTIPQGIQVIGVTTVSEVLKKVFNSYYTPIKAKKHWVWRFDAINVS
ncbi:hypothetical protein LGW64_03160, partial [Streptococcus mutans]|nr:hypothetical protein [Streptococcus mutans]